MLNYVQMLQHILLSGVDRMDRTGVGTKSVFAPDELRYDLRNGFPLLTRRQLSFKSIAAEVLWYLRGDQDVCFLRKHGVKWWDNWVDEHGHIGPVYGAQWRSWGGRNVDQIAMIEQQLRESPASRRMVCSAWNAEDLPKMPLPPCPLLFQLHTDDRPEHRFIDMKVYQRSADVFLGLPHDIAGHALLLKMFAKSHEYTARHLTISIGDAHLYSNHLEQAQELTQRSDSKRIPRVIISPSCESVTEYQIEQLWLADYEPREKLTAPVAV